MTTLRFFPIYGLCLFAAACTATNSVSPITTPATGQVQVAARSSKQPADLFSVLPNHVRLNPAIANSLRMAATWAKAHPLHNGAAHRAADTGAHLWISDERGAIWETKAGSRATGTGKKIVGALYDCDAPLGIKTDSAGNLWAACAASGTVNMYAPKAKKATRVLQLNRTEGSTQIYANPDDVAFDRDGNVYVANVYTESVTGSTYTLNNAEIDVFLANPRCGYLPCNHATPDKIILNPHSNLACPSSGYCEIGVGYSFIDVAVDSNLYQDFYDDVYSCTQSCKLVRSNIGLDRIRNPLDRKPGFGSLIRKMLSPGGVYTTGGGAVLNMLDSETYKITRYTLFPFKKMGVLGPTPQDPHFGDCVPIAMGFNDSETLVAAGDQVCHDAIVGEVAQNHFLARLNINYGALAGAAFEPSDK